MTASNHVVTGSVFAMATVSSLPVWLILPAAFLLHFVLDSLPHFGQRNKKDWGKSLNRLRWFLPIDAGVAATMLLLIVLRHPQHWQVLVLAGILCASPDLWSISRFARYLRRGDTSINKDWFAKFHHRIQWGERLWGAWIELAWFAAFGYILLLHL